MGVILLFLLSTLGALALVGAFARTWTLAERLAAALPLGDILLGLVGLALALRLGGLTPLVMALAVTVSALPMLLWLRRGPRRNLKRAARRTGGRVGQHLTRVRFGGLLLALWYVVFLFLLFVFFRGACYAEADGAIWTLNVANLGDLPLHIGLVQGFTIGGNFPPEHPAMEGARLTYPFLVDFTAALWVKAGASIPAAFLLQNVTLVGSGVYWLWRLTRLWTRSALAAHLALPLALLSGGWGFVYLWPDVSASGQGLLHSLQHLSSSYSNNAERHLRWGNMLCVLLGTQRSMVLGMPLALAVIRLWWSNKRRGMWLAGLLTGLLPLAHIHTFASLLGVGAIQALMAWRSVGLRQAARHWLPNFGLALLLSLPSLAFMLLGSKTQTKHFYALQLGWDGGSNNVLGWMLFWLYNTGPMIPLLVIALYSTPQRVTRFYFPFLICFFGPNLLQLAPWIWDNLKVLIYWHLMSVPLVAALLARWLVRPGARGFAVPLLLFCVLAGTLDVWQVVSGTAKQEIYSAAEQQFGVLMAEATPARARILTSPTYTHPVYWAGRRTWIGYTGWLWSHGLDFGSREQAAIAIYTGAPDAEALLRRNEIDFVVVGPRERGDIAGSGLNREHRRVDEAFFARRFTVVAQAGGYTLYRVR